MLQKLSGSGRDMQMHGTPTSDEIKITNISRAAKKGGFLDGREEEGGGGGLAEKGWVCWVGWEGERAMGY